MADHAFPELHGGRSAKKEPENLLILTRTTTDRHGRRHSVAVPLIPPPDGEKFEGGYHVERNPLTGGAKLVPPPGGKQIPLYSLNRCSLPYDRVCYESVGVYLKGSTKTRTRSISEKRGHTRPSMKVTKPPNEKSSPAKNGKSTKAGGAAAASKDLLSSNLDVSNYKLLLCISIHTT